MSCVLAALLIANGCDNAPPCPPTYLCGSSDYQLVRAWTAVEYEVEVAYAHGGDIAFVCTLSFSGDDGDDDGGGAGNTQGNCTQTRGETRPIALNLLSGGTAVTLSLYDSPDTFDLTLRSDGETLFDGTFTPDYEASHVSGRPDCGACRTAYMNIDVE
jgi:hypothetical protein